MKPLGDARKRLQDAQRTRVRQSQGKKVMRPDVVIGLSGAGVPQGAIAAAFGVAQPNVAQMIKNAPNGREEIKELREALKLMKIRSLHRVTPLLMARLAHEVGTPDANDPEKWNGGEAKNVDAIMRAVHASERTEGLAAGESQKVEVSGQIAAPPEERVKLLIQQILYRP